MTSILFIPRQSAVPFLRWCFFNLWPWKSWVTVKGLVEGQSHIVVPVSYQFAPFHFTSIRSTIPEIQLFRNLSLKHLRSGSRVKSNVKVTLYPISNRCFSYSFHINRTNQSWVMAKIMFALEKTHPIFLRKCATITVSNGTDSKYNQGTTMTSAMKPLCFVVIRWDVFTLLCRKKILANRYHSCGHRKVIKYISPDQYIYFVTDI